MKFILALFMLFPSAHAYFTEGQSGIPAEMNGIKFEDFKNFTKEWHLVTVRYRKDTGEMRITYANDIAWKELRDPKAEFSDGAIFGKVGIATEVDPAFTSSQVPTGAKRFQLMVKDRKKYKSTQGWGYALFSSDGRLFDEDIKTKTLACAACHALVRERGFVFSRPMTIDFDDQFKDFAAIGKNKPPFAVKKVSSLGTAIAKHLPKDVKTLSSLEGDLKKHAFSGTLDEVIPLLIENVKTSGTTSALYLDEKNFTLVQPEVRNSACEANQLPLKVLIYFRGGKVRDATLCQ